MVVRILLLSRRHTAACHTRTTTLRNHAHILPNMAHTKGALQCATVAVRWFCRESIFDEKSPLVQWGTTFLTVQCNTHTHTRHTQNKGVCCHMGHEACDWQVPAKKRAFPMVKTFSICYRSLHPLERIYNSINGTRYIFHLTLSIISRRDDVTIASRHCSTRVQCTHSAQVYQNENYAP